MKDIVWHQFGAAIDMLDNAIMACPEELWGDRSQVPEYWYVAYHTLFWLDYYLADSTDTFSPPAPFNLDELDPAGLLPERVYSQAELRAYLEHGRKRLSVVLTGLTDERASENRKLGGSNQGTFLELMLYNMRHVQHHAGQLNLILRQKTDSAPRWVGKTKRSIEY